MNWRVSVGTESTSAIHETATVESRGVYICAHGAGGNMTDRSMAASASAFRSIGLDVVRFNFLYREKKSSRPDRMPLLLETIAAVVSHTRSEIGERQLFIGGRSMGGRAASMLCAEGFACDGLILLAYPLHAPGRQDKLRDEHLAAIQQPVLCINGTRDTFCDRPLMERTLSKLGSNWTMHWVDGADHSFHVPKSSGRNDAAVMDEIGVTTSDWLSKLV